MMHPIRLNDAFGIRYSSGYDCGIVAVRLRDLVQVLFAQSDEVIDAVAPKESFDNLLRKPFCRRMSDHRDNDRVDAALRRGGYRRDRKPQGREEAVECANRALRERSAKRSAL